MLKPNSSLSLPPLLKLVSFDILCKDFLFVRYHKQAHAIKFVPSPPQWNERMERLLIVGGALVV